MPALTHWLPADLEDRLIDLNWREIHQSDLSVLRRCRMELRFNLSRRGQRSGTSINAYLGTCFDRALCELAQGAADVNWRSILKTEWEHLKGQVWDRQGLMDSYMNAAYYATRVHDSGWTLAGLAKELLLELERHNLRPIRFQTELRYGGRVQAVGFRDLLCEDLTQPVDHRVRRVELPREQWSRKDRLHFHATGERPARLEFYDVARAVLVDLKTYGLWAHWIWKEVIKKQDWDTMSLTWNPQHRHYHWMSEKTEPEYEVQEYGIICPTNIIPYEKGDNKGQRRGPVLFRAPASPLHGYEADLIDSLESFTLHQPRDYPERFGGLHCIADPNKGGCRHRKACLEGASVDVEKLITGGMED